MQESQDQQNRSSDDRQAAEHTGYGDTPSAGSEGNTDHAEGSQKQFGRQQGHRSLTRYASNVAVSLVSSTIDAPRAAAVALTVAQVGFE